ncbi:MAG: sugar phosphate nucleotidyltransferase, partial [Streptosporangiaceae bacterium]
VLHEVSGAPMLGHVLAAARELAPRRLVVVVDEADGPVARYLAREAPDALPVVQGLRRGTGHAVRVAVEVLGATDSQALDGTVVVTYGDTPLVRGQTLRGLVAAREAAGSAITALVAQADDPTGYGRIVRDSAGRFTGIVEQADASPEQAAITEINSGMYAFDGSLLADVVKRLSTDNAKGEEYLTEVLAIASDEGFAIATVSCADYGEILGVNDQTQLAGAQRVMNDRLRHSRHDQGQCMTKDSA